MIVITGLILCIILEKWVSASKKQAFLYHLEYHMRSAELHVTGFLLEYGFEQGTNAKLGCFLDCRIYSNNNHGEFICTSGAKVLFKNKLLSESEKHQTI